MNVGVNWHLKFRLQIEELKKKLEQVTIQRNIALRKLKKIKLCFVVTARCVINNYILIHQVGLLMLRKKTFATME